MFNTKKFGANISLLRKKSDMTQSELADRLFVTRQAISKYEQGESFPEISVLTSIAEVFGITLDTLIGAGNPTKAEATVLENAALNKDIPGDLINDDIISEIINIAPLLKPSLLDKIAAGLGKHGIDISKVVELAEYMNDESVIKLLENATFDTLDEELLEKLIPLLNDDSKQIIFQKILDGELDWHLLKKVLPYAKYMYQQIEAAVVYGALDWDVIKYLQEIDWQQ
ncbi:MAG: helix-turn-helix domain-containing protein [Eubacteriales bacterium]